MPKGAADAARVRPNIFGCNNEPERGMRPGLDKGDVQKNRADSQVFLYISGEKADMGIPGYDNTGRIIVTRVNSF